MNFIQRLKTEVEHRDAAIQAAQQEVTDFLAFLHSEKFTGVDTDGSRKDWIATGDVVAWLQGLRSTLKVQ